MSYRLIIQPEAEIHLEAHKKAGNKILLKKIYKLFEELKEHPQTGTGKPEQLKHYKEPTWSRRISDKHRLVYRIQDDIVVVLVISAFGHYDDK